MYTAMNKRKMNTSRARRMNASVTHLLVMLLVMAMCFTAAVPGIGVTDVHAASAQASGKVNASGGACLRAHTNTGSKQLAMVSDNTGVTILREVFTSKSTKATKRWYYVSVNGKEGYIRSDLIDSISYANIPATVVTRANYRTGPSSGMTKKGSVSNGQSITILSEAKLKGKSQKWYRASINGGSYYISDKYVSLGSGAAAKSTGAASKSSGTAAASTRTSSSAPAVSVQAAQAVLSKVTVDGQSNPSILEVGGRFTVKGIVNAPEPITSVTVGVVNASGQWAFSQTRQVNAKRFDIYSIDKALPFGTLPAGKYTYRVDVTFGGQTATKVSAPFEVSSDKLVAGLLSNPTNGGSARYVYTFDSSNCRKLFEITGFSKALVPQAMTFTGSEYYILYGMNPMQAIVTYSANGQKTKSGGFAFNIGHPNGITWDPQTGLCYIFKGGQTTIYTWNPRTNKYGKSKTPYSSSGLAYDKTTNVIYASSETGIRIYSADGRFKHQKLFSRCKHSGKTHVQDCGAQDGFIFHGVSGANKHKTNYLDVYRASDCKYLGSIRIALGEIESAVVGNDGYLQLLVNTPQRTDYIWKTPLNINDLKK